jgi:hypothetical protein
MNFTGVSGKRRKKQQKRIDFTADSVTDAQEIVLKRMRSFTDLVLRRQPESLRLVFGDTYMKWRRDIGWRDRISLIS